MANFRLVETGDEFDDLNEANARGFNYLYGADVPLLATEADYIQWIEDHTEHHSGAEPGHDPGTPAHNHPPTPIHDQASFLDLNA